MADTVFRIFMPVIAITVGIYVFQTAGGRIRRNLWAFYSVAGMMAISGLFLLSLFLRLDQSVLSVIATTYVVGSVILGIRDSVVSYQKEIFSKRQAIKMAMLMIMTGLVVTYAIWFPTFYFAMARPND